MVSSKTNNITIQNTNTQQCFLFLELQFVDLGDMTRLLKKIAEDVAYNRNLLTALNERVAAVEKKLGTTGTAPTESAFVPSLPIISIEAMDKVEAGLEDPEAAKKLVSERVG